MLMEFEKHRADRKALSVAFKPEPMRHYAAALNDGIRARVAQWSGTTFPFYPAIKQLTLDLAATSFLGIPWGPGAERINKAFVDMVQASIGVVRVHLGRAHVCNHVTNAHLVCHLLLEKKKKQRDV